MLVAPSAPALPSPLPPDPAAGPPDAPASAPPAEPEGFPPGERVCLRGRPRYLKSADPMPMLRPPDLIDAGEWGEVVELRPLGQRAVRFRRGTFLLGCDQLESAGGNAPNGDG